MNEYIKHQAQITTELETMVSNIRITAKPHH